MQKGKNMQGQYTIHFKLNDTLIGGLKSTIGYLDLRQLSIEEVVDILDVSCLNSQKTFTEKYG